MANKADRGRLRDRIDPTAIHRTQILDAGNTVGVMRLDIVAQVVSIAIPSSLTATVEGSQDGHTFFSIAVGASNTTLTYGKNIAEHLVKVVRVTRTAGSGVAVATGV